VSDLLGLAFAGFVFVVGVSITITAAVDRLRGRRA
jgi:hypothetical protein